MTMLVILDGDQVVNGTLCPDGCVVSVPDTYTGSIRRVIRKNFDNADLRSKIDAVDGRQKELEKSKEPPPKGEK